MERAFFVTLALGLVALKGKGGDAARKESKIVEVDVLEHVEAMRGVMVHSRGEMALQRFKSFLERSTSKALTFSSEKELLEMAGTLFLRIKDEGSEQILAFVTEEMERIFGVREPSSSLFSEMGPDNTGDSDATSVIDVEIIEGLTFLISNAARFEGDGLSLSTALITAALDGVTASEYEASNGDAQTLSVREASDILHQLVDAYLTGFCREGKGGGASNHLESLPQAEEYILQRLAILHMRVGAELQDAVKKLADTIEAR